MPWGPKIGQSGSDGTRPRRALERWAAVPVVAELHFEPGVGSVMSYRVPRLPAVLVVFALGCGDRTGLEVLGGPSASGGTGQSGTSSGAPTDVGGTGSSSNSGGSTGSGGSSSGSGGGSSSGGVSSGSGSPSDDASLTEDAGVAPPPLDAAPSCPIPSAVVVGARCALSPYVSCSASPVSACGTTTTPVCSCQSFAWACVTSFPSCTGGPCPPASDVIAGASCTLPPDVSCSASPVPACGTTTTPACTCQSRAWACVTSYPHCP
jgi:hypothetical protein